MEGLQLTQYQQAREEEARRKDLILAGASVLGLVVLLAGLGTALYFLTRKTKKRTKKKSPKGPEGTQTLDGRPCWSSDLEA